MSVVCDGSCDCDHRPRCDLVRPSSREHPHRLAVEQGRLLPVCSRYPSNEPEHGRVAGQQAMFSATLKSGNATGSWCMKARPIFGASCDGPLGEEGWLTMTSPPSGSYKPARMRMSVDFPAPFSPSNPWISPARKSRSADRSAAVFPKTFLDL